MTPRVLLNATLLLLLGVRCAGAQPTGPAQVSAAIMLRDGETTLIGMAPYNPRMDDASDSPADKDGYAWVLRDAANTIVRRGRGAKSVEWRSEWDAAGNPDPRRVVAPTYSLGVVVPNIGGTLVIYDAPAGADTGPHLATLRLPVVPAGAVVCLGLSGTLQCDQ